MSFSLLSPRTALVPILLCAVASAQEAPTDPAAAPDEATPMEEVIAAIIDEGKNNSQVWETLTYISEEIGPRLTGSSALERANVWSRDRFTELGLTGARLHRWGEVPVRFDRGPSSVKMVGPVEREIEFTTRAWGAGTDGPVRGLVVKEPKTMEELEAVRDQLEGAWLLSKESRRRRNRDRDAAKAEREERKKVEEALEGFTFLGKLRGSSRDEITTGGVRGWRELTMETLPTEVEITIRRQDYDAINSRLSDGEEVEIEADLKHYFTEGPFGVFNTIAEIRGTEFSDEVVIISAHLDSWNGPGSQGTQDNGTGSSVTLETARILMAAGVQPRRTIRFCLWSGEEQGLLGSRGYVESLTDEELEGISACFVDDGGTYYQGGLFCIESMEPMLSAAIAPVNAAFPELPIDIEVRDKMPRGGSSDHASFNRKGVPGFFWTEKNRPGLEGMGYQFSWHTQRDTLEYAIEEYLIQSATCSAVTAYSLAMADTLLPRYIPEPPAEEKAEEEPAAESKDTKQASGDSPITGDWSAEFTTPGLEFGLVLAMDSQGAVTGTMVMGDDRRKLEKGKWDAAKKTLTFQYESDSYGRLTATGKLQEDGSLKGDVKSSPDSDGYAWVATRKAPKGKGDSN
ncbi:MAG: M20/M25/M40 family metallo-hydrolase [Planctomycetes bacterium]|nr:M20/M25/M40 family metallo-hydrolase [Planctomycetota bacterium]